ncbi:transcription factor grauzone-like [Sitodiplosis mosellana]|uniref:transcription factor grauzone-like n=1 Tax=Sitodiplosis mosellana TaxID=263140 RepID=UPI0024444C69|nr:transcription factor grauzone-like [Sitodiplosis mosellana]XP_055318196.1 transcription factor grauzone-like [Sitodiplosis mosellana]
MEICRLCLLNNTDCINIFSVVAPNKNVAEIISKHVGEVIEADPLPNHVCMECWTKIDNFHEFHTSVQTAQARYLNDFVKYERETNHFVDVLEPIHLNIDTATVEPIDVLASVNEEQNVEYETCKSIFIESMEYAETLEDDCSNTTKRTEYGNESDSDPEYSIRQTRSKNTYYHTHKKQFICDICSHTLSSKQKILEHLLRHVKYMCPICSERCPHRIALDAHIRSVHYKDKMERLKKQLDTLTMNKDIIEFPNSNKIEEILSKYYDAACDICSEHLPASLEQIQAHHDQQHAMKYCYLKCCNGLKLETIEQVNEHVIFHLYPEYYKCQFCGSRFVHGNVLKRYDLVRKHIVRHLTDAQKNAYICIICRARFASNELLNIHRKYNHGIESDSDDSNTAAEHKKYDLSDFFTMRCDLCDDVQFATFQDAKQHYRSAHEINGYLVCCDKKFMKPKTIDDHFRWHINPEYLKCRYCGKCFNQKIHLTVHISKHKAVEEKRFSCPKCHKAFHCNHYLKKHMKMHDDKVRKKIPCSHCNKQYSTEQSLNHHIRYAHSQNRDSKGVICEICGKTFVSQTTVKTHIRFVHLDDQKDPSKRSQCTMCDASFINKYRLKKHVDSIHMALPVKCELCDKVAPNPAALVCHMKSVHVAQNFQCHLCAKAFKAAAALKDHIATHTGEKLYKCSFCPEAFIWRPNMYSHQKKAHPEEWKSKKNILK